MKEQLKPVFWMGSSLKETQSFPEPVRREIGHALYAAQQGETDPSAKPLKGFGGAAVMEIVAPFDGNTWRAIYTVRFLDVVYVLHAFQKKSKSGIATPTAEIALIRQRLAAAQRDYEGRKI
ncbi:MAG: type II toxin-antitoxin system RelE/ParE family toxin [Acidobacteriaceae bacterium]